MCGNLDTATKRWREARSCLAKTGFLEDSQSSPDEVLRGLADLVRRFTTVIGYASDGDLIPMGSGTFVRRTDGQCGILTAGHVAWEIKDAIKKECDVWVLPVQDREEVDWARIQGMGIQCWGAIKYWKNGPDLGWIPLSAEEVNRVESLGGVFHNRRRKIEGLLGEVCRINLAFGFVGVASCPSTKEAVAHAMFMGKTNETTRANEDWDYAEYAITSADVRIPMTHGGVSGSAVWRIDLMMDGKGKKTVQLDGLLFAEGGCEDRKLVAHGPKSLHTILLET